MKILFEKHLKLELREDFQNFQNRGTGYLKIILSGSTPPENCI